MGNLTARRTRGERFAGYTDLTTMICPDCGVLYAIPERMRSYAEERGGFREMWFCPNGHELGYGDDKLDRERQRAERAERAAARERALRDQAEQEARVQKGRATRFKNDRDRIKQRIAEGVCPCCNRTFKNVQRHMRTQHPEFKVPEDDS